jgi:hypothetical protein
MAEDHYRQLLAWLLQRQVHLQQLNKTAFLELVLQERGHHIHSMVASFSQIHQEARHQMMEVEHHTLVHCYLEEDYLENHQNLSLAD